MQYPSELVDLLQPVAQLHVPYPISWADEERDLTSWLGNELQDEAFSKLYGLTDRIQSLNDQAIQKDWQYLQTTDHFYYMCTKWFSDGGVHKYFNPYPSPYEAFINYMNVLSDFSIVLDDTITKKNAKAIKPATRKSKEEEKPEKENRKTPRKTKGKLVEEEHVRAVSLRKRVKAEAGILSKTAKKSSDENPVEKDFKPLNFETIISLSDAKVKKIIKNVEIETLTAAMKSANKDVREKVEKNLGKRALNTYKDLLKQLKTISESEIKKSRKLIEKQIKLLTK